MGNLTELPNIGKVLSARLAQIGITTTEEFKHHKSEDIFMSLTCVLTHSVH